MNEFENKERIIQEFVPGKQVTLAHIIPKPVEELYQKVGLFEASDAIGIFTITPSEASIIAADVASKAADIKIGFVDRFNGSVVITGSVTAVETSIESVIDVLCGSMGFASTEITRS